jgi:hypothetical protein
MSPRRNLKPREDGIKKVRTEQSSYQFQKIPNPSLPGMSSKHLKLLDQQEEKSIGASTRRPLKKITNAIRKPTIIPNAQEINEHIFGYKRQWGYNHTNLTGLENGEHSLIMLVYNIKRSINILGVSDLIAKLKNGTPYKAC